MKPLSALLLSFALTMLLVPLFKKLAVAIGFVDKPDDRHPGKIHKSVMPLLGGGAVFTGIFLTTILLFEITPVILGIVTCSLVLLIVGTIDDRRSLTWLPRLMIQITLAFIMVTVFDLKIKPLENQIVSTLLSMAWIVGITNAINFIDNIDGVTSGITSISSLALAVVAITQSNHLALILSLALFGASLAFLKFNFKPASIFLGDAGTLFIGFLLSIIVLLEAREISTTIFQYLSFPFFLGLPILDTFFATIRRLGRKAPIYLADGSNLTYRFLEKGLSERTVIFVEYSLHLCFTLIAFGMLFLSTPIAFLLTVIGFALAFMIAVYLK